MKKNEPAPIPAQSKPAINTFTFSSAIGTGNPNGTPLSIQASQQVNGNYINTGHQIRQPAMFNPTVNISTTKKTK